MERASTISRSVEIGLRFIGMWPDSAYSNLSWSMYMTAIAMMQYCQYSYIITHFDLNNLLLLADCLGVTLTNTHSFLKLVVLWWNRRIFYDILKAMDKDWSECVISDSYRSSMTIAANRSRRYSFVLIGIHALTGFFAAAGTYIFRTMSKAESDVSRELPVKMKFPFEVNQSPLFECILIGQFLYELSLGLSISATNALLVTLILHVGGQIDIMRETITQISCNNDAGISGMSIIRDLIYRHQKIITLSDDIENLFSSIALMLLLWNTLVICFSGFMIIIVLSTNKGITALIKPMLLYILKTLEVFVFCYAGEFLSAKSKSISDAVYESLWYNMLPSDCHVLLIIMVRSQKRLTVTAGKIFDLTLEGFMSVMKASVSYISVLHAMY